jgi:hypothetical protein
VVAVRWSNLLRILYCADADDALRESEDTHAEASKLGIKKKRMPKSHFKAAAWVACISLCISAPF